jgi:glycosyltransferase involved in cell wall biosynthesis
MPPRIGVFHPGTQHSWQTARAFQETSQLGWYATSIFYDASRFPYSLEPLLPQRAREAAHRRFLRRFTPELDPQLVRTFGLWEWIESAAAALQWNRMAASANHRGNRAFASQVTQLIQRESVDILWGFDTSSLQAFRWAKARGIACVLERTSIHPVVANGVAEAEYQRHPEFFAEPWKPKPAALIDEEEEEIALADLVIVGSRYCAESLVRNGCAPEKIRVVAYGFDERGFPADPPLRTPAGQRPLEFLFVGNINALKGMAYLLEAFANLPAALASLTLVGGLRLPPATFARYADRVRHAGALSRSDVIRHYRASDCLVFPSLLEGSAVVLREIYGAGLGALQTRAAGDGIAPDTNGAFIEPSSVEAIVRAIENLIRNPADAERWSRESWARREAFTWAQYRSKIREAANSLGA